MSDADAIAAINAANIEVGAAFVALGDASDALDIIRADLNTALAALQAPPPPPPPSGTLLFEAPFAATTPAGTVAPFQALEYVGTSHNNTPPASSRLQYDGLGAKIIVEPGDAYFTSTGERCLLRAEINPPANPLRPPDITEGMTAWFGVTLTLDPGWQQPNSWSYFFEIHEDDFYEQAAFKMGTASTDLVRINAGVASGPNGPFSVNKVFPWPAGSPRPGVSHRLVWGGGWSSGPAGQLEVDVDGAQAVSWSGPNLVTGLGATINYSQLGHYRGASPFTSVLHLRDFRMGTTKAVVA